MKTKGLLRIVVLFFCVIGFSGCNDDESEFSSTEIQQALFDMKGTYKGAVEVSYYRGKEIATFPDGIAVSKDSLIFKLPLSPIAEMIKDENISRHLRECSSASSSSRISQTLDMNSIRWIKVS